MANIYLNEFDKWVENTLIPENTMGKRQRANPEYARMNAEISKARKAGDHEYAHRLIVERRNIPSVDTQDEGYTIYSNMTDPLIDAYVQSMLEEIERKISALQAAEMTEEVASMLQDLEEQREYYAENLYAVDLDDIAAWISKVSGKNERIYQQIHLTVST